MSAASFLLLAGGTSRRMGRDKALLSLDGTTILERLLRVGETGFADRVLVTNQGEAYRRHLPGSEWQTLSVPDDPARTLPPAGARKVIADRQPDRGPVAGLEVGLWAASTEHCFVVACDLPFVTAALAHELVGRLEGHSSFHAIIPVVDGRSQPLCAAYRRSAWKAARTCVETDRLSMREFLEELSVEHVDAAALDAVPDPARTFLNVNCPEDLAQARKWC